MNSDSKADVVDLTGNSDIDDDGSSAFAPLNVYTCDNASDPAILYVGKAMNGREASVFDVEGSDEHTYRRNLSRCSAITIPKFSDLPPGKLLHIPCYEDSGVRNVPLPRPITSTISTASRPYIYPLASDYHPPFLEFSLLNPTEFIIETDSLRFLMEHKAILSALNAATGIRFDPLQSHWVCPLSEHDSLSYALHSAGANPKGLPRRILAALSLSAQRRGGEQTRVDVSLVQSVLSSRLFDAMAPFQREGVAFAIKNEGKVFIADEMGLGKTIQALGVAAAYSKDWPVLIVCPSGARYHWKDEILQWLAPEYVDLQRYREPRVLRSSDIILVDSGSSSEIPVTKQGNERPFKFLIISYALVSKLQEVLIKIGFNVVIIDESHYLKNYRARRTVCVEKIVRAASRAVLLSGTPALSRPLELFPQLHALQPDVWPDMQEFSDRYCRSKNTGRGKNDSSRSNELHTLLLGTVMIRRLKADIMTSLPAKKRIVELICMDGKGNTDIISRMEAMLALVKILRSNKDNKDAVQSLEAIYGTQNLNTVVSTVVKSKRENIPPASMQGIICVETANESTSDNKLNEIDKKRVLMDLYTLSGQAKAAAIIERINTFLSDPNSGKLVVFVHHRAVIDSIADFLDKFRPKPSSFVYTNISDTRVTPGIAPFNYIRIDGGTLPKQRHDSVTRFQTQLSTRVALLSITAAGVALTLTAASTLFFGELYWTPGSLLQAEDRVHRIGQTATVRVFYLLAKNSIDEVLWPLVRKKLQTLGHILDGDENVDFHLHQDQGDSSSDDDAKENGNFAQLKRQISPHDVMGVPVSDHIEPADMPFEPLEAIIGEIVREEQAHELLCSDSDDDSADERRREKIRITSRSGQSKRKASYLDITEQRIRKISCDDNFDDINCSIDSESSEQSVHTSKELNTTEQKEVLSKFDNERITTNVHERLLSHRLHGFPSYNRHEEETIRTFTVANASIRPGVSSIAQLQGHAAKSVLDSNFQRRTACTAGTDASKTDLSSKALPSKPLPLWMRGRPS